jgi:hypothetical protein
LKYLEDRFNEPVVVDNGADLDSTEVVGTQASRLICHKGTVRHTTNLFPES